MSFSVDRFWVGGSSILYSSLFQNLIISYVLTICCKEYILENMNCLYYYFLNQNQKLTDIVQYNGFIKIMDLLSSVRQDRNTENGKCNK